MAEIINSKTKAIRSGRLVIVEEQNQPDLYQKIQANEIDLIGGSFSVLINESNEKQVVFSPEEGTLSEALKLGGNPSPVSEAIEVAFSSPVSNPVVQFADLKYDTLGAVCFDWDDGSLSSINALTLFNQKTIDDGSGTRSINWRAAVAVIGRSTFNNVELGDDSGANITYAQMLQLIASNWTIANHGLYSTLDDGDPFPEASQKPWSAVKDIEGLDALIQSAIQYQMATTAVPGNFQGYVEASRDFGYLAATSQRDDVGGDLESLPAADYLPLYNLKTADASFKYFLRFFKDGEAWGDGQLASKLDQLVSRASTEDKPLLVIGTHDSDSQEFVDFINYADTEMAGKIWVVSMKEMMEYFVLKETVQLTAEIVGNTVKITVDYSNVPPGIEHREITLLVSDTSNTITAITNTTADDVTSNINKGLINIYK